MRRLLLGFLCWLCWGCASAQPQPTLPEGLQALRNAQVTVTVGSRTSQSQQTLPYLWDRQQPGQSGSARFEVGFSLPKTAEVPYGAYFLRLGNTYEVWLNGVLLQRKGDLQGLDGADYAKVPRYVAIPAALLHQDNLLSIRIHADVGRRGGLAPIILGPEAVVMAHFVTEAVMVDLGTYLLLLFGSISALLLLPLWLTQTEPVPGRPGLVRGDRLYLYAAMAEMVFLLRLGNNVIERPPLPWAWWNALNGVSLGGWVFFTVLTLLVAAGWDRWLARPWVWAVFWAVVLSGGLASYASIGWQQPLVLTLWYGALILVLVPFGSVYLVAALRRPVQRSHLVMAIAFAVNVATGAYAWCIFRFGDAYGQTAMLAYSNRLFGVALGYIAIRRFWLSRVQVRDLIDHMAQRIADKEAVLQQSHQQMDHLVREQARTDERTRILRDMHDGVGAHLSTAIRQLQSGKASQAEVLYTLRDSLDHLKLSMDALHLLPGDVTALLANLRYRLTPRFAALDIELCWDVDALEPLTRLDGAALRQLQFMLFEALHNVLQHAQAHTLWIQAKALPEGGIRLQITDDGCGFDTHLPLRNGLLAMHERARVLGVVLTFYSAPGCTEVVIEMR